MRKIKVRQRDGEVREIVLDEVKTVKDVREVIGDTEASVTIQGMVVEDSRQLNDGDVLVFSAKTEKPGV